MALPPKPSQNQPQQQQQQRQQEQPISPRAKSTVGLNSSEGVRFQDDQFSAIKRVSMFNNSMGNSEFRSSRPTRPPTMYNIGAPSNFGPNIPTHSHHHHHQHIPLPPSRTQSSPVPNPSSSMNNNNNNSSSTSLFGATTTTGLSASGVVGRQRLSSTGHVGSSLRKTLYSLSGRSGSTTVLDTSSRSSRHASIGASGGGGGSTITNLYNENRPSSNVPFPSGSKIESLGGGHGLDTKKLRNFSSTTDLSRNTMFIPTTENIKTPQSTVSGDISAGQFNTAPPTAAATTVNFGPSDSTRSSLGSQLVIKEGYLSKKSAANTAGISFPTSLTRGWKVYRVALKGAKLFFYKPPSESEMRELFPDDHDPRKSTMLTTLAGQGNSNDADDPDDGPPFPLNTNEIDSRSQKILYESSVRGGVIVSPLVQSYVFGECFSEIDPFTFKFKRYVCVLIFKDTVVVLKRKWIKQNIASSFIGAVSNKMKFGRPFAHRRSKLQASHQSPKTSEEAKPGLGPDNASLASAANVTSANGKGYFTKWQHHASYPIQNIEIVGASSSKFGRTHNSVLNPPVRSSQSSMYSIGNESVSSFMTGASTVSKDYSGAVASGAAPGFHMFVSGRDKCTRMFAATTAKIKNDWINQFNSAKASIDRAQQMPRPKHRRPTFSSTTSPQITTTGIHGNQRDSKQQKSSSSKNKQNSRSRLYWSVDQHPSLFVTKKSDAPLHVGNQGSGGKSNRPMNIISGDSPIVVSGSATALVHEFLFQNTEREFPGSNFSKQFVSTFTRFISMDAMLVELEHYSRLIMSEDSNCLLYIDNLVKVVNLLASEETLQFRTSDVELLKSIVDIVFENAREAIKTKPGLLAELQQTISRIECIDKVSASDGATGGRHDQSQRQKHSKESNSSSSSSNNSSGPGTKSPKLGPEHPLSNIEELSRLPLTGLTPSILFKIQPQEIARQLYFFHAKLYKEFKLITPTQLLPAMRAVPGAPATATTLTPATATSLSQGGISNSGSIGGASPVNQPLLSTLKNPHFLTRLVHHHLLVDLPAGRPARRGNLLLYWVRVGEACRAIGDATSWAAIATAVTNPAVIRLRETWQAIPLPWKMLIVQEWIPKLMPFGLYSSDLAELSQKTLTTRPLIITPDAAHAHLFSPLPYYGPIMQSVERVGLMAHRQGKLIIANNDSTPATPDSVIFLRYAHMYELATEAVNTLAGTWICEKIDDKLTPKNGFDFSILSSSSSASKENGLSKNTLAPHPEFQQYLEQLNALPPLIGYRETKEGVPSDYDTSYLLGLSLKCESSIGEQFRSSLIQTAGFGGNATVPSLDEDIRAAPGSILPLVCPEIVPSTNVLQWIHPITQDEPINTFPNMVKTSSNNGSDSGKSTSTSTSSFNQQRSMSMSPAAVGEGRDADESHENQMLVEGGSSSGTKPRRIAHKRSRSFPSKISTKSPTSVASADSSIPPTQSSGPSSPASPINSPIQTDNSIGNSAEGSDSAAAASLSLRPQDRNITDSSSKSPLLAGGVAAGPFDAEDSNNFKGKLLYAANGDLTLRVLRVQYQHSRSSSTFARPFGFLVEVQGGTLPILVDLLLNDIKKHSNNITDSNGFPIRFWDNQIPILTLNHHYAYRHAFLSNYRCFCTSDDLVDYLQSALQKVDGAKSPWEVSWSTLDKIIDTCSDWVTGYIEDFLDSITLRESFSRLILQITQRLRSFNSLGADGSSKKILSGISSPDELLAKLNSMISQFVFDLLVPSGYSPLNITLERQLKRALKRESQESRNTGFGASRKPFDELINLSAKDTLVTLNRLAQTHYAQCTMHDWLATYCMLEVQTHAPLPWYPAKRHSTNPSEEDVVISDIYRVLHQTVYKQGSNQMSLASVDSINGTVSAATGSAIQGPGSLAAGGVTTKVSLWERLPNPIKILLDLHRIVRHWVIKQITDPAIEAGDRVERIQKFIEIIYLCRYSKGSSGSYAFKEALDSYLGRIKSTPLLTKLDFPECIPVGEKVTTIARPSHYVPSFVERAVASALVSPESRRYTRAWNLATFENGTTLESLDALLLFPHYPSMFIDATKGDNPVPNSPSNNSPMPQLGDSAVPCIGWLLENMISLCYDTPDRLPDNKHLINIAKRQRMFMLISICNQLVIRCQKSFTLPTPMRLDLGQLAGYIMKEPLQYDDIKRCSTRENVDTGSYRGSSSQPDAIQHRLSANGGGNMTADHYYSSSNPPHHHALELSYLERPFGRLVADELEKLRQEQREREGLERMLRERELEIGRQTQERNKQLKRQLKEDKQRRARNETLVKMTNLMNKVTGDGAATGTVHTNRRTEFVGPNGAGDYAQSAAVDGNTKMPVSTLFYGGDQTSSRQSRLSAYMRPAMVINLINSVINPKEDYTKRDFVFLVVTEEGGEYLLQAPDEDEMDAWIEAMRDAATEAAARRLTVFVEEAKKAGNITTNVASPGELMGGLSNNPSAPASPISPLGNAAAAQAPVDPVFGVSLEQLMPNPNVIPRFFELCLEEIESRGLEEVGIYRLSGSASGVNRLRNRLNQDHESVDLASPEFADINIISNIVKLFLRELPEPLLTFDLYEPLIDASSIDSYDDRLWAIKDLIHQLPLANYTLLKRLIEHLEKVTDFEQINHMYSTNLALVFGPSLLRPPPSSSSFAHAMSNLGQAQNIIKNLILQFHWIFDIEEDVEAIHQEEAEDEDQQEAAKQDDLMDATEERISPAIGDTSKPIAQEPTKSPFSSRSVISSAKSSNCRPIMLAENDINNNSILTSPLGSSTFESPLPSAKSVASAPADINEGMAFMPLPPLPTKKTPATAATSSLYTEEAIKSPKTESSAKETHRGFGRMMRSKSIRKMRQAAATMASMVKSSNNTTDHPMPPPSLSRNSPKSLSPPSLKMPKENKLMKPSVNLSMAADLDKLAISQNNKDAHDKAN
ncbi:hypothetical protein H4219_004149 [Mycoemilia scoparia]|uniref:Uncharacterized protein n=1 Tax=Mycoemilia scoparia TaxID=417184 RepID=A0A9W8A0P7_9FUNG|nr:hypothetical protein H4219_004149 [Mycoemilia scoparia]